MRFSYKEKRKNVKIRHELFACGCFSTKEIIAIARAGCKIIVVATILLLTQAMACLKIGHTTLDW